MEKTYTAAEIAKTITYLIKNSKSTYFAELFGTAIITDDSGRTLTAEQWANLYLPLIKF